MTTGKLNVVFMGTPDFSVPALAALAGAGHRVVAVYAQPPRPRGRGQKMQKAPVHLKADELGLPVFNPVSLKKDKQAQDDFIAHDADVAIVAAYGLILPRVILDAPRFGCINIHASLLPRWRGASPIQRAIWSGDHDSGITIMQMEEGLDTGPMIARQSIALDDRATTSWLHDRLSLLGAGMIIPVLDNLAVQGAVAMEKQDDTCATYAAMLKKDDGRVDWTLDALAIDRQIRALTPWPGVWSVLPGGKRLKILMAEPAPAMTGAPGTVLDRTGHVACGAGTALRLISMQPENARPMDAAAAINGHHIHPGLVFS